MIIPFQKLSIFHYKFVDFGQRPDKLRFVGLPILPPSECLKLYLCAGSWNDGRGICDGDSGGPLVVPKSIFSDHTAILIGVTSSGAVDCDGLSVFAPVIPELKWIKANMGKP